jgi:hypothetical protein
MEIRVDDAAGGPVAAAELAGGEDVAVDGDGVWVAERWPTGRSRLGGGKQVDQPCPTEAGDRPSLIPRQSFPSTIPGLDECASTGSNCTLEQLCEFWNLSCDLVTSSSTSDSSLTAAAQTTYNDGAGT